MQQKQLELERQKVSDNLKKGLAHRPEREELVERKHTLPPFSPHIPASKTVLGRGCFKATPTTTGSPSFQLFG